MHVHVNTSVCRGGSAAHVTRPVVPKLLPCAATLVVRNTTACRSEFGAAQIREQKAADQAEEEEARPSVTKVGWKREEREWESKRV